MPSKQMIPSLSHWHFVKTGLQSDRHLWPVVINQNYRITNYPAQPALTWFTHLELSAPPALIHSPSTRV